MSWDLTYVCPHCESALFVPDIARADFEAAHEAVCPALVPQGNEPVALLPSEWHTEDGLTVMIDLSAVLERTGRTERPAQIPGIAIGRLEVSPDGELKLVDEIDRRALWSALNAAGVR